MQSPLSLFFNIALGRPGSPPLLCGGLTQRFVRLYDPMFATASLDTLPSFLEDLNNQYEAFHKDFEADFWATKMGLAGNSTEQLTATKGAYDGFLRDKSNLQAVRAHLQLEGLPETDRRVLKIMERTFACYNTNSAEADAIQDQLTKLEGELQAARGGMKLGYTDPATGSFNACSSVQLRTRMRTSSDEAERKACFEGVQTIGPFVAERFVEIVRLRNRFARALGYEDFYDYKVTQSEGFGKAQLFAMLDDLEQRTRSTMEAARARLASEKGPEALEPWNTGYMLAGETTRDQDPYFPFGNALAAWSQTFAGLGIDYKGARMRLDLLDRPGKYSNGFCHWPQCAWRRPNGSWVPSQANFTSLATPGQVGSGVTALRTLLHEGGHAAHFANIDQPSPFFSQERAPMSVAYAENQSMFLDSLQGDAAWLGRFARDQSGAVMPWELVEKDMRATSPYAVLQLRGMLAVPYFEKALYELADDDVTVERLLKLGDEVQERIQGGPAALPLLAIPHILSDESSCYYHGYVLAEMSVFQTRTHFLEKYGRIVDEPRIGADLTEVYWNPGNGEPFLGLVEKLTGKPLSADAWVADLNEDLEERIAKEKQEYEAAVKAGPRVALPEVDLGMQVVVVNGDEQICDSNTAGLGPMCNEFAGWVDKMAAAH